MPIGVEARRRIPSYRYREMRPAIRAGLKALEKAMVPYFEQGAPHGRDARGMTDEKLARSRARCETRHAPEP